MPRFLPSSFPTPRGQLWQHVLPEDVRFSGHEKRSLAKAHTVHVRQFTLGI